MTALRQCRIKKTRFVLDAHNFKCTELTLSRLLSKRQRNLAESAESHLLKYLPTFPEGEIAVSHATMLVEKRLPNRF